MSNVEIKYAPFWTALEDAIAEDILSAKRLDPLEPIAIIAPSSEVLYHLKSIIASRRPEGLLNVNFYSFFGLAAEILRDKGNPRSFDDPMLYEFILSDILRSNFGHSRFFGEIMNYQGVSPALLGVISDLRDAGISPEILTDALKSNVFSGEDVQKIREVFKIYGLFKERTGELNLKNMADSIIDAAELAPDSRFLKKFVRILYYGFYDLTGVQLDFLDAVCSMPNDAHICIYFPFDKPERRQSHPAFNFAEPVFNHFCIRRHHPEEIRLNAEPKSIALGNAAEYLFNHNLRPHPLLKGRQLELLSTSGTKDELWITAKKILELAAGGTEFNRIMVLSRTLDEYAPLLKEAFDRHCIPFYTTSEKPVSSHPLIKTFLNMLTLPESDYGRQEVMELFVSPYFRPSDKSGETPDVYAFDELTRALGIVRGREEWNIKLNAWINSESLRHKLKIDSPALSCLSVKNAGSLLKNVNELIGECEKMRGLSTFKDLCGSGRSLLKRYITAGKDDAEAVEALDWLENSFNQLENCSFLKESWDGINGFMELFKSSVSRVKRPVTPERIDGVKVMDIMSARGITADYVFILGMNEKVFPRVVRQEPFLSDSFRQKFHNSVRRKINELGYKLDEKMRGYDEEKLLFYMACCSAKEGLFLSYQRSDEGGKKLVESAFLREIRSAVYGRINKASVISVKRRLSDKINDIRDINNLTPDEIVIKLHMEKRRVPELAEFCGIDADFYKAGVEAILHTDSIYAGGAHTPALNDYDCVNLNMSLWWEKRLKDGIAPTFIEAFAKCPYMFYCANVLGLEEKENPEDVESLDNRNIGIICHEILKKYYAENAVRDVAAIALESFDAVEKTMPTGYPLWWASKKEIIVEKLRNFIGWDREEQEKSGLKPGIFEKRGEAEIMLGNIRVKLKGFIDRIDLKPSGSAMEYRVIDYKSRDKRIKGIRPDEIQLTAIQLPLYILLAGQVLRDKFPALKARDINPVSAAYYFIFADKSIERRIKTDGDSFEKHKPAFAEKFGAMSGYVASGLLFINPESGLCRTCTYKKICRRENYQSRQRALGDSRTKKYFEELYD